MSKASPLTPASRRESPRGCGRRRARWRSAAALIAAPPIAASFGLVASCSGGASPTGPGGDATVDGAGGSDDGPACVRSWDAGACTDDPRFVYSPALACDPAARAEAGLASATDAPVDASDASGPGDGGIDPCLGSSIFDVYFTPQACAAFVAAEAAGQVGSDRDPRAPVIDGPSDGAQLTADNWSIFYWHSNSTDSMRGPVRKALDWLEPTAYAYPPLRGDAYVLEFSQGCQEILRVMVATPYWEPDPASWAHLSSVGGPVRIQVIALRFQSDSLAGTPLPSVPITITMTGSGGG